LAKRKRTLLESNPLRNSQLETHRDDEAGGGIVAVPGPIQTDRIDRFPDAGKNSPSKLPRSGLLLLCEEVGFELRRRHIADRGVKTFLVINLLEKYSDCGARFVEIPVFVAMNFLVF
jgi:hypothetical protein